MLETSSTLACMFAHLVGWPQKTRLETGELSGTEIPVRPLKSGKHYEQPCICTPKSSNMVCRGLIKFYLLKRSLV